MNATTETLRAMQSGSVVGRLLKATGRALVAALVKIDHWREVSRQRKALLTLDDHLLKDIGLNRLEAQREGSRPFWEEPGGDGWRPGRR